MTLSKVSFSDILRNNYLGQFDTFRENFDFDTFKNDTFKSVIFRYFPRNDYLDHFDTFGKILILTLSRMTPSKMTLLKVY